MKKSNQYEPWTEREFQILKECYPMGGSPLVMERLKEEGFPARTKGAIGGRAYKYGIKSGLFGKPNNGQFKPGQTPPNKGKKMSRATREKVARTWFKKGGRPHNTLYQFAVSYRPGLAKKEALECPWFVRWALGEWVPINQWAWSEMHGDQPEKHIVSITDHAAFFDLVERYFPKETPRQMPDGHWENLKSFVKEADQYLELFPMSKNANRNWEWETGTRAARELTFNYVAGRMTENQPELRQKLKTEFPHLIEAKRQQMLNRRSIKKIEENA